MSERKRGKRTHSERGRMRPVVQHQFDSTLGYPGEGPEHNEGGAWVAVNVAGVHVSVSREASDVEVGEAGSALIHDYTDKLWELVQVFKGLNAAVMVLADTHAQAEEAEVIKSMLVEQGIEVAYTPAILNETGHTTAGVMIWTNPNVLEVRNQTEIIEGRILRIGVEDIATEEEWAVYGAYMPVRGAHDTALEVEETWGALRKRVNEETVVRTAVGGDLNAETHEWRQERRARCTPSDAHLDEMMEESDLTALAEGSTHRSGTQIDNWLMTPAAARGMGASWVLPGVCGKDHDMVVVRRNKAGQEQGERRPTNSAAKAFFPESKDKTEIEKIQKYAEEAERLYLEGGGKLGEEHEGENAEEEEIDWAEELRTFQRACTTAAEGQARRNTEPRRKRTKEEKRARIGKWNRISRDATKWNGRLNPKKGGWQATTFATEPKIAGDEGVRKALREQAGLKAAVLEVCQRELDKAVEAFEDMDAYRGNQLIREMEETVTENTGSVMVKIFQAIRKAVNGSCADEGIRAVRDTLEASAATWKPSDAPPDNGIEIDNQDLRARVQKKQRITESEWEAMGAISERLTRNHYVVVSGQYYSPSQLKIHCTAEAVKSAVHREATQINATHEADVSTLKKIMEWIQPSQTAAHVDVAKDLCTWEACKAAIRKGFKKGKGMGTDGFDGYLVRLLPQPMQKRYWTILREIVRRKAYPREWNEWIAILAMKPGEDPKTLERRRDLWLQCHSMKCVMRMILPAYERAVEAMVGTTNAGWTRGRMAPEQTLAARLLGEMRMRERTVSCRGYCDLGCFFMSVVHKVQWEVERWSGTPVEVTEVLRALREGAEGMGSGEGEKEMPALTGRYETAYGLTAAVRIAKGLGQGDIGSPERSKILIAIIAKTVSRLCEGAKVTGSDKRVSMLFFADDGLILADDVQTLRRAFEAMWIVARVAGLRLQVKGKKKTAWSATYWESDGTERDVTGWEMVMPDGSTIPQLEGDDKYKYLGTELTTGWNRGEAQAAVRKKVVAKCRQAIGLIARIPLLSEEQLAKAIELAMAGIIGYYGRSTVITWEDAVQIENARGEALRAKGFTTGLPKATLYANRGSGLEHTHAYAMAAAALCDQVERALQGGEGVAARAVVEAELANTCARLGCRDVNPLEWHGISVVSSVNRCSFFRTAFQCILAHCPAFA